MTGRRGRVAVALGGVAGMIAAAAAIGVGGGAGTGCSASCCTVDENPIVIERAPPSAGAPAGPGGGLLARGAAGAADARSFFRMSVDTGAPLTVFGGPADGQEATMLRAFDILDATAPAASPADPVRAQFQGIDTLNLPLGAVGDAATTPAGILGADLLGAFSVELRLSRPSITFWSSQRATDGFLEDVGYAVIHFTLYGGGEVTANGDSDFLGLSGPLTINPSRIVFRACAAPALFDPSSPTAGPVSCCKASTAVSLSTGTPLALMLATGVGPLVLSRSAFQRAYPDLAAALPPATPSSLYVATSSAPLAASWTTLPADSHLALVNQEAAATDDPGPCVELARSRRIEWVAVQQAAGGDACVQPCDTDPLDTSKAQNSAAYLELGRAPGDEMPVAVIDDTEPWLQGLRTDIRPEGPEIDGVIGAGALGGARVELDYRSSSPRAIFSCDGQTDRQICFAGARCPRLPDQESQHACFNLPLHGLPATCAPSGCQP
jgi:hypothetical protein